MILSNVYLLVQFFSGKEDCLNKQSLHPDFVLPKRNCRSTSPTLTKPQFLISKLKLQNGSTPYEEINYGNVCDRNAIDNTKDYKSNSYKFSLFNATNSLQRNNYKSSELSSELYYNNPYIKWSNCVEASELNRASHIHLKEDIYKALACDISVSKQLSVDFIARCACSLNTFIYIF